MQQHIRKANIGDIPRLKEIRVAVKENKLMDPSRVTDDDIRWFIENGPIWVWEQNAVILGFSAGDPREGSIWALFVDPVAEGQGIGSVLFNYCCKSLIDAGHKKLKLHTGPGTRAERFYKARGWTEQPPDTQDEILLTISV